MNVYSSSLDVKKFKKGLAELMRTKSKAEAAFEIAAPIIEGTNSKIQQFLREIDSIEDKNVQRYCRMAAIAQMYGVGYNYCSSSYVSYCNDKIVLIKSKCDATVLSKYGEVIIPNGEIWTHGGLEYPGGFTLRKVIDGVVSEYYGLMTSSGKIVLPCIFDYLDQKMDYCHAVYRHVPFKVMTFGTLDSIEGEMDFIKGFKRNLYISDDNVVFTFSEIKYLMKDRTVTINEIESVRSKNYEPATVDEIINEVLEKMSQWSVSFDDLQMKLASK